MNVDKERGVVRNKSPKDVEIWKEMSPKIVHNDTPLLTRQSAHCQPAEVILPSPLPTQELVEESPSQEMLHNPLPCLAPYPWEILAYLSVPPSLLKQSSPSSSISLDTSDDKSNTSSHTSDCESNGEPFHQTLDLDESHPRFLLTLGARVPRNKWEYFRNISGSGSILLHCNQQTHLWHIWNVLLRQN